MRKLNKKSVAISAAVFTIVGTGAALAYWTETGSGSGSAAAGSTSPVTVVQTSTVTGLYPGGPAQALSGTFNNPNPGKVFISTVKVTKVETSDANCLAADFTIGGAANVNAEIAAGTGVGAWNGLTIKLENTGVSQDACKNATVTLTYAAA